MEKLQSILSEGVVKSYQGAQKTWMEEVTEDQIYADLNSKEFQSFVGLIEADALGKTYSIAG